MQVKGNVVTGKELGELVAEAANSPRRRMNLNMHEDDEDVNFFFSTILHDSYIRPHRHNDKHKYLQIIRGKLLLLEFDDTGNIIKQAVFDSNNVSLHPSAGSKPLAYKIQKGSWHTILALSSVVVVLEVNSSFNNSDIPQDLAPWAPAEDDPASKMYIKGLRALAPR
ncbi:MAG: WbuC family cupin fold metalloprotein [Candidatus Spechtbacterales bacterium]|nr:WbuC family cupin fold metalloprotein [Candidatus Spechtbacterales bacterium]